MPVSAAERQKQYRERLKRQNPQKFKEVQRTNAERTRRNRKRISDFEPDEQNELRRQWRENKKKIKDQVQIDVENNEERRRKIQVYIRRLACKLKNENSILKTNIASMKKEMNNLKRKLHRNLKINKQLLNLIQEKKVFQALQEEPVSNNLEHTPDTRTNIFIEENLQNISIDDKNKVKKILLEHNVLVDTMKECYKNSKKISEKKILRNMVSESNIVTKYNMKTKMASFLGMKSKIRHIPIQKKNSFIQNYFKKFFERDDISKATAGKKEFKTHKKQKTQRRYLLGTLKQLHQKYKSEGGKISFTTFKRNRPFYILRPKVSNRNTCACKRHENLQMKADELKAMDIIETKSLDELLLMVVCDAKSLKCCYGECNDCKVKTIAFKMDGKNLDDKVSWSEWILKNHEYDNKTDNTKTKITKKMVKERKDNTLKKLLELFTDELKQFRTHAYNILHQYREYQRCINNLNDRSIALHIDFSENYACKLSSEVQAMHFGASRQQITLHTGLIYSTGKDPMAFTSISPCNDHGPEAIWAHLTPILQLIRKEFPNVHAIHFFSDGPTVQYKQKKNFFLFCKFTKELGFPFSTWNFFESAHGKGAADGIGAAIKRNLDSLVSYGADITDAETAYRLLKYNTETKIILFYIPKILENVNTRLFPVPGTMAIHQLRNSDSENKISYRTLSCFCNTVSTPGYCQCLDLKEHNLKIINNKMTESSNKKRKIDNVEKPTPSGKKYKTEVNSSKMEDHNDVNIQIMQKGSTDTPITNELREHIKRRKNKAIVNSLSETDEPFSDIQYAESDDRPYYEQHSESEENALRTNYDAEITSFSNNAIIQNTQHEKPKQRVTILSDVRLSAYNQAYPNLKQCGTLMLKEIDKNFELCPSVSEKGNNTPSTLRNIKLECQKQDAEEKPKKYEIHSYLLAKLDGKKTKKYYVGKILNINENGYILAKFMRKKKKDDIFYWPDVDDIGIIFGTDIECVLSKPQDGRRGTLKFKNIDFSQYDVQ